MNYEKLEKEEIIGIFKEESCATCEQCGIDKLCDASTGIGCNKIIAKWMLESENGIKGAKTIEKKILPQFYKGIVFGHKAFEIRKDEDNAEVGDILLLREWDGEKYTGRQTKRKITCILRDCEEYGLMSGYCIYAIEEN